MTKLQLLEAFYSRIGGKPDEFPEPLVLGKADQAMKTVAKELVYSMHPSSHLFIREFAVGPISTKDETTKFFTHELGATGIMKTSNKFLSLIKSDGKKMEPTNSWDALETLPVAHNQPYYKWSNNRLYISLPDNPAPANVTFKIQHYAYPETLSNFPYELVDILVNALLASLMPAAEPEKNNAKRKK